MFASFFALPAGNQSFARLPFPCGASASCDAPSVPELNAPKPAANLYEILRVEQNASPLEIKTAYRTLAKQYHPDAAHRHRESDGREFMEIRDAYSTLSDPVARALYDVRLKRRRRPLRCRSGYYQPRNWETDQCW